VKNLFSTIAVGMALFVSVSNVARGADASKLNGAVSPSSASPTVLSGSAGEWNYRCTFPPAGPGVAPLACVMEQRLMMRNDQKQVVPLGGVILAKNAAEPRTGAMASRPWRLTLMTPLGMSLQAPAQLSFDKGAVFPLPWQTCVNAGCLSGISLSDAQLAALRHGKVGHIMISKLAGGTLTINFALDGADTGLRTLEGWSTPAASSR
jgi:invasion protein IalB